MSFHTVHEIVFYYAQLRQYPQLAMNPNDEMPLHCCSSKLPKEDISWNFPYEAWNLNRSLFFYAISPRMQHHTSIESYYERDSDVEAAT